MTAYKMMYYTLFNAVTSALLALENQKTDEAVACLQKAQAETEEMYLQMGDLQDDLELAKERKQEESNAQGQQISP